jgi:hypothetical protein
MGIVMRARWHLLFWLALFVVSLVVLPALIPPQREPTYTIGPLAQGDQWIYQGAGPTGVAPTSGPPRLYVNVTRITGGLAGSPTQITESFQSVPRGPPSWPWLNLTYRDPVGTLVSLGVPCGSGNATITPDRPVVLGLSFPLTGASQSSFVVPGNTSGDCPWGPVRLHGSGAVLPLPPATGENCGLYVCNLAWTYRVSYRINVTTPTGTPLLPVSFEGIYDPSISGYRSLGANSTEGNWSGSLAASRAPATTASPALWVSLLESLGVILMVPLVALVVEGLRFRQRARRQAEADRKELSDLLPPGMPDPFDEPLDDLPPPPEDDPGPGPPSN